MAFNIDAFTAEMHSVGFARPSDFEVEIGGDILSKVGDVVNSPLARQVVGYIAPSQLDNLAKVQSGVNKATSLSQQVGATAGKVADITAPSTYFGQNPVPAVRNAVERAKDIGAGIGGIRQTLIGGNPATYTPMGFR